MDIFEYLPQLIIAYDGNDEFANLIHVKKADKDNNYFCPCCGGTVKPRALDSTKEQSHYYHITGKCTKESQLHFFCKNWLFEKGSKFYIDDNLFEVDSIDIEKIWNTQFGDYKPDITVYTTSGEIIYFEMFFSNRKTGDDYFCKWNALGNDVVEVNIKEYMFKTDADTIPAFTYLYHDGTCYSKLYMKRDLYANTIAKIKRELTRQNVLNYKARIEQLDWFWNEIRNNKSRADISETISKMEYDDMVSCYEIIKRKQCVSYLKNDVLAMINQKVISDVRKEFDFPHDENIYFDLEHIKGRTYKFGIRLDIKTDHIIYNKIYSPHDYWCSFDSLKGFPKIVFSKNILNSDEIKILDNDKNKLRDIFKNVQNEKKNILEYEDKLTEFEKNSHYKVRMNNDLYTVIREVEEEKNETILEKYHIYDLDIKKLNYEIEKRIKEKEDKELINSILENSKCKSLIYELNGYKGLNCSIDLKYDESAYVVLYIGNTAHYYGMKTINMDEFIEIVSKCKCRLDKLYKKYDIISNLVNQINACKNKFWSASISFISENIEVIIEQVFDSEMRCVTREIYMFAGCERYSEKRIKNIITTMMQDVLKNMEDYGYRVMEVRNEK